MIARCSRYTSVAKAQVPPAGFVHMPCPVPDAAPYGVYQRQARQPPGAAVRCIRWFAGVSHEKDDAKRRIADMIGELIPVTERLPPGAILTQ